LQRSSKIQVNFQIIYEEYSQKIKRKRNKYAKKKNRRMFKRNKINKKRVEMKKKIIKEDNMRITEEVGEN
jgi:hypothetical protein